MANVLFRELQNDAFNTYQIVAYLDDDAKKHGRSLHGCRIYGSVDRLTQAARKYEAELILIAIANIEGGKLRKIVEGLRGIRTPL